MRTFIGIVLLAIVTVAAQRPKETWQRVYTSADSIIELDAAKVVFVQLGSKVTFAATRIGRVRFRTTLSKPEALKDKPTLKYKTRLENIEFKCDEKKYRVHEASLFDDKGKLVKSIAWDPAEDWKEVRFGSMMEKLALPACKLIDEKRQSP